jgi:hypothetical protein
VSTRRGFLLSTLALIGGSVLWRVSLGSEEQAIVRVLRKRLDYLQLDDEDLHTFARDLLAQHVVSTDKLKAVGGLTFLYQHFSIFGSQASSRILRHGEERIVSFYLLSSTFFLNGADESKPVRYISFYNPLDRPCGNPFARLG